MDSIGCVECPAGKAGVDGWCLSCVNGSQPNSLRSACEPCPRGGYSPNGETCLTCGPGTRPAPSGLLCESCDPGYAGFLGICEACVSSAYSGCICREMGFSFGFVMITTEVSVIDGHGHHLNVWFSIFWRS